MCNQLGLNQLAARYTRTDATYKDLLTNVLGLTSDPALAFNTTCGHAAKFETIATKDVGYFGIGCGSGGWGYKAGAAGVFGCDRPEAKTERDAKPKCNTVQHSSGAFHGPSICVCGAADADATATTTAAASPKGYQYGSFSAFACPAGTARILDVRGHGGGLRDPQLKVS